MNAVEHVVAVFNRQRVTAIRQHRQMVENIALEHGLNIARVTFTIAPSIHLIFESSSAPKRTTIILAFPDSTLM